MCQWGRVGSKQTMTIYDMGGGGQKFQYFERHTFWMIPSGKVEDLHKRLESTNFTNFLFVWLYKSLVQPTLVRIALGYTEINVIVSSVCVHDTYFWLYHYLHVFCVSRNDPLTFFYRWIKCCKLSSSSFWQWQMEVCVFVAFWQSTFRLLFCLSFFLRVSNTF